MMRDNGALEKAEESVTRLLDLLEMLEIRSAFAQTMDRKWPDFLGYISPFVERMMG